jgi:hypothetical protein
MYTTAGTNPKYYNKFAKHSQRIMFKSFELLICPIDTIKKIMRSYLILYLNIREMFMVLKEAKN